VDSAAKLKEAIEKIKEQQVTSKKSLCPVIDGSVLNFASHE
jgi:hypothetical protein